MKWIKHDTDANQDAKLQNVLLDYGLEGYGLYWYCIELIAGKVDKENITFELEHDARIIARNVGSTPQKVEEMMRYFVEVGLFENSQGVITCLKLAKRLDKSMTSNPQMREIIDNFKSHDGVMTASEKPMQDKIRLDQNRIDNPQPPKGGDRIDYEKVKELWNHYASQNPDTAKKVRVVSQKTKRQLPQLRKRYKSVCKELDREPKPFDQWLNNYIQAAIADASTWVGRNGDHAEWKANLEWVSRVKTYDNLLNKQEQ